MINPEHAPAAAEVAHGVRNEFVLRAEGEVVARAPELVNPNLPTGEVELRVETLEIVSTAPPLPFQLDEEGVDETLRLRYRWLDLRREKLQRNIRLRSQMVSIIRRVMESAGFLDIQTPILFKPTPEGARDFVVPSRLQPGRFYALPQSPQILKQLLVIAGFDRYYQIAVCFRDEDLRADRVQEITQLDVEMAFPDREFIIDLMERMVQAVWRECIDVELAIPFRRMSYDDAMLRYGTDKPDLRFGLEIEDVTEVTRGSEFKVFAGAEAVRLLRVPRRDLPSRARPAGGGREGVGRQGARLRRLGGRRAAHRRSRSSSPRPSSRRFAASRRRPCCSSPTRPTSARGCSATSDCGWETSSASSTRAPSSGPGSSTSRCSTGRRTNSAGRRTTIRSRVPLPSGKSGSTRSLRPAKSSQYDLVGNGNELGGGSFRIHEAALQERVFGVLQLSPEEQRSKFGFLLDALAMGAPPHGGIAFGIDRMLMVLAQEPNLRDTIAFPKNQAGVDPMSGAPSEVPPEQLDELGVRLIPRKP